MVAESSANRTLIAKAHLVSRRFTSSMQLDSSAGSIVCLILHTSKESISSGFFERKFGSDGALLRALALECSELASNTQRSYPARFLVSTHDKKSPQSESGK